MLNHELASEMARQHQKTLLLEAELQRNHHRIPPSPKAWLSEVTRRLRLKLRTKPSLKTKPV